MGYAPASVVVRSMSVAMSTSARPSAAGEVSTTLAAASGPGATYSSPTFTLTLPSSPAWLSSAYPIEPLPLLTAEMTPEVPSAASPPLVGQTPSASCVQAPSPALLR